MSYRYDNFPSGDYDAWKTRSDLDDNPREEQEEMEEETKAVDPEDYQPSHDIVYLKDGQFRKLVPKNPNTNPFQLVGALIALGDICSQALPGRGQQLYQAVSRNLFAIAADELQIPLEDLKDIVVSRFTSRPMALVLITDPTVGTIHSFFEDTSPEGIKSICETLLETLNARHG